MASSQEFTGSVPMHVPRRRWGIAWLLGFGILVNYFDRVNLSVAQSALHADFGISTVMFGYLLSAYSWPYAALQVPCGLLLDRFGVKLVGRISSFIWSVATFAAALSAGVTGFLGARLLLGVGEAPTFPASAKAVGYWFPDAERSLGTAFFDAAPRLAAGLGIPVLGALLIHFGWRWSFAATGIASLVYFAFFYAFYRNPSEDKKLSQAEREFIARGGAQPEDKKKAEQGAPLLYLLGRRKVWGLCLGYAAYNYCFYLLLYWLPSYFMIAHHVNLQTSTLYVAGPWLIAFVVELAVGGWLVDFLIRAGRSATRVRQAVLIGGTSLGLALIGIAGVQTPRVAMIWITIALAGLSAASSVGWSIPSLIAPRESVGTLGGILNTCNQIAAISSPVITGYVVKFTKSFDGAFIAAGAILFIGICGYIFLLGRITPIPEPT
jgi:MFS transporter, ACS family, D-galactonate transporter